MRLIKICENKLCCKQYNLQKSKEKAQRFSERRLNSFSPVWRLQPPLFTWLTTKSNPTRRCKYEILPPEGVMTTSYYCVQVRLQARRRNIFHSLETLMCCCCLALSSRFLTILFCTLLIHTYYAQPTNIVLIKFLYPSAVYNWFNDGSVLY